MGSKLGGRRIDIVIKRNSTICKHAVHRRHCKLCNQPIVKTLSPEQEQGLKDHFAKIYSTGELGSRFFIGLMIVVVAALVVFLMMEVE